MNFKVCLHVSLRQHLWKRVAQSLVRDVTGQGVGFENEYMVKYLIS